MLGLTADPTGLPPRSAELFGTRRIVLASDMVTSHAGALGTDFATQWARRTTPTPRATAPAGQAWPARRGARTGTSWN
ncbi:hypothetical protein ACH4L7_01415 [Streptomyces anulatus]